MTGLRAAVLRAAAPRAAGLRAAVLGGALVFAAGELPGVAADAPSGAAIFAGRCAVCHGAQAAGIPGAFPSLQAQIAAFGKLPQGRDYLVMVVTTGLMGDLKIGGVSYRGVMPAQSGLSEAEVAAVLSYLVSNMGKDEPKDAITAADVIDARARHPDKSAQTTRTLRPAYPEQ